MLTVIGAREARHNFSDLLSRVGYGGEVAILGRFGKPLAALIPMEMYEQIIAEREARFQVVERIQTRLPEVSEDEIRQDVEQAIAEVRDADVADRD